MYYEDITEEINDDNIWTSFIDGMDMYHVSQDNDNNMVVYAENDGVYELETDKNTILRITQGVEQWQKEQLK